MWGSALGNRYGVLLKVLVSIGVKHILAMISCCIYSLHGHRSVVWRFTPHKLSMLFHRLIRIPLCKNWNCDATWGQLNHLHRASSQAGCSHMHFGMIALCEYYFW